LAPGSRAETIEYWLSLSNALSRRDLGIATGLAESRINQIIREQAEADQHRKNVAATRRTARHVPDATFATPG
jgi:hypothetical protein